MAGCKSPFDKQWPSIKLIRCNLCLSNYYDDATDDDDADDDDNKNNHYRCIDARPV